VQAFLGDPLDDAPKPTRRSPETLKRSVAWLVDEGELDSDPLLGMKPPKGDRKLVHALTDDELKRLIKACQGKSLQDRRDEAMVRSMAETGMRASEVMGLQVADIDLRRGLATIHRGQWGKGRIAPFGSQTAAATDRYMRARRSHPLADTGDSWVGGGGKSFGYHGLSKALKDRAEAAGIKGFHLHIMRHTAATRGLRAGGSEGGLMAVARWSTKVDGG
jgi:integrase